MKEIVISVAKEFSQFPGGRWKKDGPNSGEEFREKLLKPALLLASQQDAIVVIWLDGVAGYGSSFLEEIFGGIVRSKILPLRELSKRIQIRSNDPVFSGFLSDATRYFRDEIERAGSAAA